MANYVISTCWTFQAILNRTRSGFVFYIICVTSLTSVIMSLLTLCRRFPANPCDREFFSSLLDDSDISEVVSLLTFGRACKGGNLS